MKRLDSLLITSFIPPFIVTFMIAIFVLLMQILWLYIDDIAGKGLGFFLMMELLAYKCVALVPMALPLAILISSVMVLGGLAEHYELSSFKSAGVSLMRTMRPLIIIGFGTTIFSYFCSNNLIPVANLKFGSRMYDIQRQKPALRLDSGVFNDDFQGYAIHIGEKKGDGKTIQDILIYDHQDAGKGKLSEIIAEDGEMYGTEDGKYFIMNLRNGAQYIETNPTAGAGNTNSFPFVRTSFKQWTKVFDLSEFQLSRTNEELFKQNRSMLTSDQLREAVDSIALKILQRRKALANHVANYFTFIPLDSTFLNLPDPADPYEMSLDTTHFSPPDAGAEELPEEAETTQADTAAAEQAPTAVARQEGIGISGAIPQKVNIPRDSLIQEKAQKVAQLKERQAANTGLRKPLTRKRSDKLQQLLSQLDTTAAFNAVLDSFPLPQQNNFLSKAKTFARSILSQAQSADRTLDNMRENEAKHIYELHTKYSMAVICFIFVFIGAPMGAIVRKGGFGYPILISVIFFMLFVVLTIFCRKIAETFVVPAAMAAWIPCAILFPIGLLLTYKAMNDSKLVNPERIIAFFKKLFPKKDPFSKNFGGDTKAVESME